MSRLRRAKSPPAPEISGGTKELASLSQTCHMCPSQWEGRTVDGEYVYIRFRWGTLTLCSDRRRTASRSGATSGTARWTRARCSDTSAISSAISRRPLPHPKRRLPDERRDHQLPCLWGTTDHHGQAHGEGRPDCRPAQGHRLRDVLAEHRRRGQWPYSLFGMPQV